jgi:hypothetical protein
MIILPFMHKQTVVNHITVHAFTILTVGGVELWEEEDTTVLEENGIFTESITQTEDIKLCRVDTQKTKMSEFYKWEEITDQETFCWRTLYTFGDQQNWLPHPEESIGRLSYHDICRILST